MTFLFAFLFFFRRMAGRALIMSLAVGLGLAGILALSITALAASGSDPGGGSAVISQADFVTAVTAVLAILAPLALKLLPADLKGEKMAAVAWLVSALLAGADLYLTGQLAHFNAATSVLTVLSYVGATQTFYMFLKDRWSLADPPIVPIK